MNTKLIWIAVAFVVGGGVGALAATLMQSTTTGAFESRARDYCGMVNAAVDLDARDLARVDDPKRQRAAADRFMTLSTYHSEPEILMCSGAAPDLSGWQGCWLKYDYLCLETVARAAAQSTKPR